MSAALSQAPMTHSRHRLMASSIAKHPPRRWADSSDRFRAIGLVNNLQLVAAAAIGVGLLLVLEGGRAVAAVPRESDPLGLPIE